MDIKGWLKKFIPWWFLSLYHFILAFFGALIYGFPSRKLKVIGVTGTNGKTTTTEMIAKIFEEAGYKIALMNSIRFKIGQKEEINALRMTMPGRFLIQRFLRKAVNSSCKYAILEVTSEGVKQHRHRFIHFEVAVFTNLSPEHIEAHGSFEKYREAKGKFFKTVKKIQVVNIEDENANYFLKFPAKKKVTFGLKKGDFNLKNTEIKLKIPGEFNLYNALAAFSVAFTLGIDPKIAKKALENFSGVPGRMEEVISRPFKVIVDYAFTPNALEKVYQTLSTIYPLPSTRLICVLGACGGGRDKWKRPILGKLAAKYCNEVIVTNEDPYDEDPWQIIEQVALGAREKARKILDRREAIREALKLANEGDVVVITGKGCEPSICLAGGKKIPWNEKKVVQEEFQKIYEKI